MAAKKVARKAATRTVKVAKKVGTKVIKHPITKAAAAKLKTAAKKKMNQKVDSAVNSALARIDRI
jgi:hypothetical protein